MPGSLLDMLAFIERSLRGWERGVAGILVLGIGFTEMGHWSRRQNTIDWQELTHREHFGSMSGKNVDFGITQTKSESLFCHLEGDELGKLLNPNSRLLF